MSVLIATTGIGVVGCPSKSGEKVPPTETVEASPTPVEPDERRLDELIVPKGDEPYAMHADGRICPPNFVYVHGGPCEVVREGERWPGGERRYTIDLAPYCLGAFEASQADATAESRGSYANPDGLPPPAQVKKGVVPWYGASRSVMEEAVQLQGWRLPTYEELQCAATQFDAGRKWVWGDKYDCKESEKSWFAGCDKPYPNVTVPTFVTGGPTGRSDYGTGLYDLIGGLSEWTATLWDAACFGAQRFSLWGGTAHIAARIANHQERVGPSCWVMADYAGHARGEHEHPIKIGGPVDDGFRPAANPSPHWKGWAPRTEPDPKFRLSPSCFYLPDGRQRCYQLERWHNPPPEGDDEPAPEATPGS
ncbi:MAG: SUMF1/EgtB/PvdO family nonheme iron enzyme [Deltaproteobacteria bacterium]|nr:SUMF1/EgtB/PvdO family nonheme iron enzyme [Deltaproteobacteria bacterium]